MRSASSEATSAVRALARLSRVLERRSGDLGLAHYRVLAAVAAGDERASRVAARLALGKPAVSASVETLSARGLLARAGVASDQRAVALAITPVGQQLLDEVDAAMASELSDLASRTGEPATVLRSLSLLGRALDQRHAERQAAGAAEAARASSAPGPKDLSRTLSGKPSLEAAQNRVSR